MHIESRFAVWSSVAMIVAGVIWGFCPPLVSLLAGWSPVKILIVPLMAPVFIVWGREMRTSTKRVPFVPTMVIPLIAVTILAGATENDVPAIEALQFSGAALALCGAMLLLIFGVGFGRRNYATGT